MIGKRFGRLIVLSEAGRSKDRLILYLCKCDCGNEKIIKSRHLKSGESCSCGCYAKDQRRKSLNTVTVGQKYGLLEVVSYVGSNGKKSSLWECVCECGNKIIQTTNHLTTGNTKSCGCISKKDLTGKTFRKLNVIKLLRSENQNRIWLCQCECGNTIDISTADLSREYILSCGCSEKYSIECIKTRRYEKYVDWRKRIFERDEYRCSVCGKTGGMHAHHLVNYIYDQDHSYDLNNGITMCKECHRLFHKTYGVKNNTKNQFKEFTRKQA
jgi:hypothetical protein